MLRLDDKKIPRCPRRQAAGDFFFIADSLLLLAELYGFILRTFTISNILLAQMLYQQALDARTDIYADYCNKLLEHQQSIGE